jgi:myo-inositol 2-dehydrogenase/D-chiro-inositol 1-dehydrogenase
VRIRVAVAGLGVIAQTVHLPLLERLRELFELVAVCDLSASLTARLGERYGVARRHTDVTEMLNAGGFDAVLVLTSGSHGRVAADALRRGFAVLCEKPLAYTRSEAAELAELDSAPGRPRLMVGYMKQHDPAVQRVAGRLRDIRAIQVTVLHPSTESQLAFARLPPPPDDRPADVIARLRDEEDALLLAALGEVPAEVRGLYLTILNSICHDLSLLRLLAGGPADIDHVATWPGAGGRSVELTGPLAAGGRYAVHWHYLEDYPTYRETVAVHHATGTFELVFPTPYRLGAPTRLTETHAGSRAVFEDATPSFERELLAFHAMVTANAPPLTGVAGAAQDIATAQLAVRRLLTLRGLDAGGEAA